METLSSCPICSKTSIITFIPDSEDVNVFNLADEEGNLLNKEDIDYRMCCICKTFFYRCPKTNLWLKID